MLRQKRKPHVHEVVIRMLDGRETEHTIQRNDTPETIIINITTSLEVSDRTLFGLAYAWNEIQDESDRISDCSAWVWLNNHKPLLKQISDFPDGASDSGGVIHFRFKFYPRPPIATTVQDDKLRHLLRLQIEQDFLDGRLDCSFHMRAYMDAYLMQAELGNYDSRLHNSSDYVRVIRGTDSRFDSVEMLQWIASYHRELDGVTAPEAESKYLSLAARLPYYGVTSFPVSSISGQPLLLHVSMDGIFTAGATGRSQQYFWAHILSLSYRRRRFRLEVEEPAGPEPEVAAPEVGRRRPNVVEYKCRSEKAAKLVWLTCMDFHMHYRPRAGAPGSPPSVKGARRLLHRTASLRRSLSVSGRRHRYSTLSASRRSRSDSLSLEESASTEAPATLGDDGDLPWRRFSEPAGPPPRLHRSTDSVRPTPGDSTPGGDEGTVRCEFRVLRLGAARLGWSAAGDAAWGLPMLGLTASGRRLYSIAEDGREFLLEGWGVREGDRLACSLDARRRFAAWSLNGALVETRSDLPSAVARPDLRPTVWDSEAELEVCAGRGLPLLLRSSAPQAPARPEASAVAAAASLGRPHASRASSATSSDSPGERAGLAGSRLSSVDREERAHSVPAEAVRRPGRGRCTGEVGETNDSEDAAEDEDEEQEDEEETERPQEPQRLEEGVTKAFLTVHTIPFVETHTTRIPADEGVQNRVMCETFLTRTPFVQTVRCIYRQ